MSSGSSDKADTRPLLLTMGDPAGIGPEITVKAWHALKDQPDLAFAVVAPPALYGDVPTREITDISDAKATFKDALPIWPIEGRRAEAGQPSPDHATTITESIERTVGACLRGAADAVITNPIAKEILYAAGFTHPGHTEYLGELTKNAPAPYARGPVMMLSGGGLSVALATIHLSLQDAIWQLKGEDIIQTATVMHEALKIDFGIEQPRISVCGLNPHAGENGTLGKEEKDIINPALRVLREQGIGVTDALPADTLFHTEARQTYDAVLAMYHDQGLIPVKTLDFHGGVNITLGLPIVRTSPDHGTAFNIAGQNKARPDSLIAAIKSARKIANHRRTSLAVSHA